MARAHTAFRLGQYLLREGRARRATGGWPRRAGCIQSPGRCGVSGPAVNELGLAALPDFWSAVDALGAKRYYAPVDMKGMPA
jgi:hypothetical protein